MSLLINTPANNIRSSRTSITVSQSVRTAVERRAALQARFTAEAVQAVHDAERAGQIQAMIDQQVTALNVAAYCAQARFDNHVEHMLHVLACERAAAVYTARKVW